MLPNLRKLSACAALVIALSALSAERALAQSGQQFPDEATRYMALGDSIPAGYKALPATNGYPYVLYQGGVFDKMPQTLFCNLAVPGATSQDVLVHQVPQALIPFAEGGFHAQYITLTVGGNDLLAILRFASSGADQAAV